jgi:hypothetical protein
MASPAVPRAQRPGAVKRPGFRGRRELLRRRATPHPFGTYEQRLTGPTEPSPDVDRVLISCQDFQALLNAGVPTLAFSPSRPGGASTCSMGTGRCSPPPPNSPASSMRPLLTPCHSKTTPDD